MALKNKLFFKQNDNNLAVAYYRYSSSSQNEASIDQQREMAEKFAKDHGLTIISEYYDKAESGLDDNREDFNRMLKDIPLLKPAVLILWKTDRLSRDRLTLANAKQKIRESGCAIKCVAEPFINENDGNSVIIESLIEAMAQQYSENLSENITRGMFYNAHRGLYIGYPLLGYKGIVGKPYVIDEETAPVVRKIFEDYISGKPMAQICRELNAQGFTTTRGNAFTINSLRNILNNRSYIGEYRYGDVFIPDGIPALITTEMFDAVQKRASRNKRKNHALNTDEGMPNFWLTGKLFCGECGDSVQGSSGTSKTGNIYYYYTCKQYRKHKCKLKPIRKEAIEKAVIKSLDDILGDTENVASLAVDLSNYAKKHYTDDSLLRSLEKSLKDTEKALNNLVKALEQGIFSETTQARLTELEERKKTTLESIEVEKAKLAISEDTYSISVFFDQYMHADFKDDQVRDAVLDYFIDKIYLYNDKVVVTCYYSMDKHEVSLDELNDYMGSGGAEKCSTCSSYAPPPLYDGVTILFFPDTKSIRFVKTNDTVNITIKQDTNLTVQLALPV